MAKSGAVWGIDIGNCALKALRCRRHEKDPQRIVVEAFDFVEYAKILSQPEADRTELVREAIETLVSRNDFKGDRVALSVPGQSGLSRFIKLPPVEAKKIPDIVKYEARQQIPFALEDVVWDYQTLGGGSQEEDYALETEVGLFAMKRDQVHRAIQPLTAAGIEVDYVQLAPLAIYNYACFDCLKDALAEEAEGTPAAKSLLVLSVGTETTDLVVTNGHRVWQRNIPIGGSHFTRALTKELQLTFTKAEQLKRNATKAENPKQLFQAMRPVFSDLVAEIQRSIGFFLNNHKDTEIGEIIALGNAMRLPGLQRYLSQNLEQKVVIQQEFSGLVGGSVTAAPEFRANHLSFAEAYGLCVQGLGLGQLNTNLLPQEIVTQRLVRSKKPWAVGAASLLLFGLAGNYVSHYGAYASANVEQPQIQQAMQQAEGVANQVRSAAGRHQERLEKYDQIALIRANLLSNEDGRLLWLELLKAIETALPKDQRPLEERLQTADDVRHRTELHVEAIDCEFFAEVAVWHAEVKQALMEAANVSRSTPDESTPDKEPVGEGSGAAAEGEELAEEELLGESLEEDLGAEGEATGPRGPGWIIQLSGYHLHNNVGEFDLAAEAGQFVRQTLIANLRDKSVSLPDSNGNLVDVSMPDLGISYPVLVSNYRPVWVTYAPNAVTIEEAQRAQSEYGDLMEETMGSGFQPTATARPAANPAAVSPPEQWKLRRYDFEVQFIWQPRLRGVREDPALAEQLGQLRELIPSAVDSSFSADVEEEEFDP